MRKTPLYFAIAVATGLLVMIVPLLIFVEFGAENPISAAESLSGRFLGIEGPYASDIARPTFLDFQVPVISLVIAAAVYLLVRRRV